MINMFFFYFHRLTLVWKMSAPMATASKQRTQDRLEKRGKYAPKQKKEWAFYSFEDDHGQVHFFKTKCNADKNPLCYAALKSHMTQPATPEELLLYGIKPKKVRVVKEKNPKPKPKQRTKKVKEENVQKQLKAKSSITKQNKARAARQAKGKSAQVVVYSDDDALLDFSDDTDDE